MLITKTSAFNNTHGLKVLVSGQSGAGKTYLTSTMKEFKPLLISAESGVLSLQGHEIDMIDISKDENGNQLELNQRLKRLGEVLAYLKQPDHGYRTVILDSLTEVNQFLMAYLKTKFDASQTLKMFGENKELMIKLVKEFRDLPMNVVIIVLSNVEKDEMGRRFTGLDVVGSVSAALPALFDEVFNLQIVEDENKKPMRRLQCRASETIICKDRSGKLDQYEKADLGYIFKKIMAITPVVIEEKKK